MQCLVEMIHQEKKRKREGKAKEERRKREGKEREKEERRKRKMKRWKRLSEIIPSNCLITAGLTRN